MSETGFRIFNQAFSAGAELTYAALLTAFFRPFVPQDKRRRGLPLVFFVYILFEIVCNRAALPQGSFGLILMAMLLAVSRWIGLEKPSVFLLTLLYFNARISSGLMVQSLYFIVERLVPYRLEPPEAVFLRAAFLVMMFLVSHAALLAVMLYALQHQVRKQRMTLQRRELCYISLVPTAGILFGQVISRLLIEFKDGVLLQLYERHPAFLAVVPVLALLFYAGAYLTIAFQQGSVSHEKDLIFLLGLGIDLWKWLRYVWCTNLKEVHQNEKHKEHRPAADWCCPRRRPRNSGCQCRRRIFSSTAHASPHLCGRSTSTDGDLCHQR